MLHKLKHPAATSALQLAYPLYSLLLAAAGILISVSANLPFFFALALPRSTCSADDAQEGRVWSGWSVQTHNREQHRPGVDQVV